MSNYLPSAATPKRMPQDEPILGMEMVENNAGGWTFEASQAARLERFLILGCEGGTYYVREKDLTRQNLDNIRRICVGSEGVQAVELIKDVSIKGRAPSNDPALYALAMAACSKDGAVRKAAFVALPQVARIGTHLFTFCKFVDGMRGWGRGLKRAVRMWYHNKNKKLLAYQVLKYQGREGWTHKDVLRMCHLGHNTSLMRWVVGVENGVRRLKDGRTYPAVKDALPKIIEGYLKAHSASNNPKEVAKIILEYGLTREMIPMEVQKSPEVWEALLENMPLEAMVRCLGRMGAVELLTPFSQAEETIVKRLSDVDMIHRQRLHPLKVFPALLVYGVGRGERGGLKWGVCGRVKEALNAAFYTAFHNVRPSRKKFYLAVDVSGSMGQGRVAGIPRMTPAVGAALMAVLMARTEPNCYIGAFADEFKELPIGPHESVESVVCKTRGMVFGGTDCAIPIKDALQRNIPVDAFVVITDGETWAGNLHNCQAIQDYRRRTGINAKMVVMNMVANATSLCNSSDFGSLDVVGFDAGVPQVIKEFVET